MEMLKHSKVVYLVVDFDEVDELEFVIQAASHINKGATSPSRIRSDLSICERVIQTEIAPNGGEPVYPPAILTGRADQSTKDSSTPVSTNGTDEFSSTVGSATADRDKLQSSRGIAFVCEADNPLLLGGDFAPYPNAKPTPKTNPNVMPINIPRRREFGVGDLILRIMRIGKWFWKLVEETVYTRGLLGCSSIGHPWSWVGKNGDQFTYRQVVLLVFSFVHWIRIKVDPGLGRRRVSSGKAFDEVVKCWT